MDHHSRLGAVFAGDGRDLPGMGLLSSPTLALPPDFLWDPKIVPEVVNFPCPVATVVSALSI